MNFFKTVFCVFAALLIASCNYRIDKTAGQFPGQPLENKANTIDFQIVEAQIFGPRCVTCHAQYKTYANVKFELSAIKDQVDSNRMPKNGPVLDAELKTLLNEWVKSGAPETLSDRTETPPTNTELQPNYESISLAIVAPKCLACHNPQGQAKFLDLSTRSAFFSQRDRVFGAGAGQKLINFEQPDASYLLSVIADPEEPMPPKYSGLTALSSKEIAIIRDWIGLGLP